MAGLMIQNSMVKLHTHAICMSDVSGSAVHMCLTDLVSACLSSRNKSCLSVFVCFVDPSVVCFIIIIIKNKKNKTMGF